MSDFIAQLEQAKSIAIFSHTNPDADAYSSSFALKSIIETNFFNSQKNIDIFIDAGEEASPKYEPLIANHVLNEQTVNQYDLAIALDCPNTGRFEKYEHIYNNAKLKVNIDHHETNVKFADINLVAPRFSSTCELLYLITKAAKLQLTEDVLKYVYIGIITDTVYLTKNTSRSTFQVLSEIVKPSLDTDSIKKHFFKASKEQVFLLEKALSSLQFFEDDRIALMTIKKDSLVELGAKLEDTLGIVEHASGIKGVQVAGILIEKEPDDFYVSLRSESNISVGEIAKQFGGGGHTNMAGFSYKGEIGKLTDALVSVCKESLIDKEHSNGCEDFTL